jgi:hypothetical protein
MISWQQFLFFLKQHKAGTNNSHFSYYCYHLLLSHILRAAANGHTAVMELLLAAGVADASITNAAGNTALVSSSTVSRNLARLSFLHSHLIYILILFVHTIKALGIAKWTRRCRSIIVET